MDSQLEGTCQIHGILKLNPEEEKQWIYFINYELKIFDKNGLYNFGGAQEQIKNWHIYQAKVLLSHPGMQQVFNEQIDQISYKMT